MNPNFWRLRAGGKRMLTAGLRILPPAAAYRVRGWAEQLVYRLTPDVHRLPPVFHYWSNHYLRPRFEELGFSSPDDFLFRQLDAMAAEHAPRTLEILSIGSGSGEVECNLATRMLAGGGRRNFRFLCNDLNGALLRDASACAMQLGLARHFTFCPGDVSQLDVDRQFDVVVANQCLHHIANLEAVFDKVRDLLADSGVFVTADVIGRNGHQLWPEALAEVERRFSRLPRTYRFDRASGRHEAAFVNYDHSNVAFEGIRAQNVLPLLLERFHFRFFAGYGCMVLPFIDRRFGWNFDPERKFDKAFIDEVARRDEELIAQGILKPTQMLACMTKLPAAQPIAMGGLTAEAAVRAVDA